MTPVDTMLCSKNVLELIEAALTARQFGLSIFVEEDWRFNTRHIDESFHRNSIPIEDLSTTVRNMHAEYQARYGVRGEDLTAIPLSIQVARV